MDTSDLIFAPEVHPEYFPAIIDLSMGTHSSHFQSDITLGTLEFTPWRLTEGITLDMITISSPQHYSCVCLVFTVSWLEEGEEFNENLTCHLTGSNLGRDVTIGLLQDQPELVRSDIHAKFGLKDDETFTSGKYKLWHVKFPYTAMPLQGCNLFTQKSYGKQTDQVKRIREYLSSARNIRLLVKGINPASELEQIRKDFDAQAALSPLAKYFVHYTPDKALFEKPNELIPPNTRPQVELPRKTTFHDWPEYVLLHGLAMRIERQVTRKLTLKIFENVTARLFRIPLPEEPLCTYWALIHFNLHRYNFSKGNRISVHFGPDLDQDTEGFRQCEVYDISLPPIGGIIVSIHPSLFSKEIQARQKIKIRSEDFTKVDSLPDARMLVRGFPKRLVNFSTQDNSTDFDRKTSALTKLQTDDTTKLYEHLPYEHLPFERLLTANDIAGLPEYGLYSSVRGDKTAQLDYVSQFSPRFGEKQKQSTIKCLEGIPGGIHIVDGPPGSAKSDWLIRSLLPLVFNDMPREGWNTRAMLCVPINKTLDEHAEKIVGLCESYRRHGGERQAERVIVRMQAVETERKLFMQLYWLHHSSIQTSGRPLSLEQPTKTLAGEKSYDASTKDRLGVFDERLVEIRWTLAWHMVRSLILNEQQGGLSPLESHDFSGLRDCLSKYISGKSMSSKEHDQFTEHEARLRKLVLTKAHLVLCTPSTAGDAMLYNSFRPYCIGIDEALLLTEADFWPLCAFYADAPIRLLVGDRMQIPPHLNSSKNTNSLLSTLAYPPMLRFRDAGFSYQMFTLQQRCVEQIGDLMGSAFYERRLQHDAAIDMHQKAVDARYYIKQIFEKPEANMVFVDVEGSKLERLHSPSPYNEPNACVDLAIIEALLDHGVNIKDIGFVCSYSSQRTLVTQGIEWLARERNLDGNDVREMLQSTIDGAQGRDRPFGVMDMTVCAQLGFLRDGQRVNVGCSRFRYLLVVVGSTSSLGPSSYEDSPIPDFMGIFSKKGLEYLWGKGDPRSQKFLDLMPSQVDCGISFSGMVRFTTRVVCRNCDEVGHEQDACLRPPSSNVLCYVCGERGHRSLFCPRKSENLPCVRCHEYGHRSIDCPMPAPPKVCGICGLEGHSRKWACPYPSKEEMDRARAAGLLFDEDIDRNLALVRAGFGVDEHGRRVGGRSVLVKR